MRVYQAVRARPTRANVGEMSIGGRRISASSESEIGSAGGARAAAAAATKLASKRPTHQQHGVGDARGAAGPGKRGRPAVPPGAVASGIFIEAPTTQLLNRIRSRNYTAHLLGIERHHRSHCVAAAPIIKKSIHFEKRQLYMTRLVMINR